MRFFIELYILTYSIIVAVLEMTYMFYVIIMYNEHLLEY